MLKKDDIVTLTIEDIGTGGEGIGKVDGYTLFVKDAVIGDVIEAKVIKAKKSYGYGRLMNIIKPSDKRVEPRCPVARQCGGCQIQQMSYDAQLEYKQKLVADNLTRIGGLSPDSYEMCSIIGMDNPYNYRNKAQFPVGTDKNGQIVMGFYAGRTHYIIDNTDCCLGAKINHTILETVRLYMTDNSVPAYDEEKHTGLARHILIRTGYHTGQIMVCLVINGKKLPHADDLVSRLSNIPGMASIMINVNKEQTNVILGQECHTLWGNSYIEDSICGIMYRISPLSFFQVNPVQTEKLYNKALEFAGLTGRETVWDLYCGIGSISLLMATKAKKVYGVEIIPQAIEDAKDNAVRNNINNAEFFVGKAEEVVPAFYENAVKELQKAGGMTDDDLSATRESIAPDVIVVDPPRKGCDEALLETIVKMSPERVVYVSCDPSTLARDLKFLGANGYKVKKVQPVDQFGHTVHVETVILLSRKTPDAIIEIDLEMSELDLTRAESKATYKEIEEYVQNKYGLHVTNLYIAQVKREFGIIERINYNVGDGKSRVPQVTPEKREAIIDALKYFQMIEV